MTPHQQIIAAVGQLRPSSGFVFNSDVYPDGLTWLDDSTTPPALNEVNAAIAALPPPPSYVQTFVLLARLTPAEYTAIRQAAATQLAAGNGQLEQWLDMARTAPKGINLIDPITTAAKAALVAAALLTQARADAVFSV
jgi:hypothetical protein